MRETAQSTIYIKKNYFISQTIFNVRKWNFKHDEYDVKRTMCQNTFFSKYR